MSFQRYVPANPTEVEEFFEKLRKYHLHVDSIQVSDLRLEIALSRTAHMRGARDWYFPLRREKVKEAAELVARHWREMHDGYPPSRSDLSALFLCIDPSGH